MLTTWLVDFTFFGCCFLCIPSTLHTATHHTHPLPTFPQTLTNLRITGKPCLVSISDNEQASSSLADSLPYLIPVSENPRAAPSSSAPPFLFSKYSISLCVFCPVHLVWPTGIGLASSLFAHSFSVARLPCLLRWSSGITSRYPTSSSIGHQPNHQASPQSPPAELALLKRSTLACQDLP